MTKTPLRYLFFIRSLLVLPQVCLKDLFPLAPEKEQPPRNSGHSKNCLFCLKTIL
jgi:hypothetical protein